MSIEDEIFDQTYEDTLQALLVRAEVEGFSLEEVKGELRDLYRYEGLDWTGRGEIKHAEIQGSIWAYRAFLHRWESDTEHTPGDA